MELGVPEYDVFSIFEQRGIRKDILDTLRSRKFIPPDYMTFYNDQRFQNIILERGRDAFNLFPFTDLERIKQNYQNFELLKSIDDLKRTLIR